MKNVVFERSAKSDLIGESAIKRRFDVTVSLLFLLFIFPIQYLLLAPIIKLSSKGPVIFTQARHGHKGDVFMCYKFRTMRLNNESDKTPARPNDHRIFFAGWILRKIRLDETPQFFNVLRGDMSIVGPRPHMLEDTNYYADKIEKYMSRLETKPGITGLAQVLGYCGDTRRDDSKMEKRVKCDRWYIENWSNDLDLYIVFKTIFLNVFK